MAITSINISRVSQNMRTYSVLDSLQSNTLNLFLEQSRLATGMRINSPSEDPVLAARTTQLTELLDQQGQVLQNIQHADSLLAATDTAIGEVSGLLIDAHDIALRMINSTSSPEERQAEAELVLGLIDQLATVGNRKYGDVFLFGGQETQTPPFTQDMGVAEYQGDTKDLLVHVDPAQDSAANLTGAELFGALSSGVSGYRDFDPALTADTRIADIRGTGNLPVQLGPIRVALDSPQTGFVVDLSNAATAGDVVDMINAAAEKVGLGVGAGAQFHASLNDDLNGFKIAANGAQITVSEVGDGVTARDLGLLGTGAGELAGLDVRTKVTETTTLESLFGGAGANLGKIFIENGHLSAEIDLAGAATVQEVLNRINTEGLNVDAHINEDGTGINVVNRASGMALHIGEAGDGTADLLGIRSLHGDTPLADLNRGKGVQFVEGEDDLKIHTKTNVYVPVNLDGAETVQDVIDLMNDALTGAGVAVTASLATNGNGITLTDETGGPHDLFLEKVGMSPAIDQLGLAKTTSGNVLTSDDINDVVPNSVFTALNDLYEGLITGDEQTIADAATRLEGFTTRAASLQGEVGARSKAMSTRLMYTEDAVAATKILLSDVRDLDYSEAVTKFQEAQMTLQANLMTGSRILQLSLLDYIQ